MRHLFLILILSSFLSGCSLFGKRANPNYVYKTETGFQFKVPDSGEWYMGQQQPNQYIFGQEPLPDDTTKILVAHHGPVSLGGMKMTNKQILDSFQNIIVREAQGGRVKDVKNEFIQKKFKNADCLLFTQQGQDRPGSVVMDMSNEGLVCLHPFRKDQYVWLAISERRPVGKLSSIGLDKTQFFDSLEFLN